MKRFIRRKTSCKSTGIVQKSKHKKYALQLTEWSRFAEMQQEIGRLLLSDGSTVPFNEIGPMLKTV